MNTGEEYTITIEKLQTLKLVEEKISFHLMLEYLLNADPREEVLFSYIPGNEALSIYNSQTLSNVWTMEQVQSQEWVVKSLRKDRRMLTRDEVMYAVTLVYGEINESNGHTIGPKVCERLGF